MKKLLSFEQFKEERVKSLKNFKQLPNIQAVCKDDLEKISVAYEKYCLSQYSLYKHQVYGGNPSTMI